VLHGMATATTCIGLLPQQTTGDCRRELTWSAMLEWLTDSAALSLGSTSRSRIRSCWCVTLRY
jgi:hypothetical protein